MTVRSTRPKLLAGMFGLTRVQANAVVATGGAEPPLELGRPVRRMRTSGNELTD